MSQRYALVTGGGKNLGSAIVRHLARQGYCVFIHYYSSGGRSEALRDKIVAAGGTAICLNADLSSAREREFLMEVIAKHTSTLHVLVNNVGWYPIKKLPDIDLQEWNRVFDLNCTAAFHITQLALPLIKATGSQGRIINIGDSACDRISSHVMSTHYHVAKMGLHILTRSYAELLMPKGITVNMISPGFLENSVGRPPSVLPAGKGAFSDVVGAVDYLISEQAMYVSGTNLLVAGAWQL